MTKSCKIFLLIIFYYSGSVLSTFGQHSNVFSLFIPHKKIAIKEFESGNYLSASKHYKVLVGLDSSDAENLLKLAYCYDKLNKTTESEYFYRIASKKANLDDNDLSMYVDVLYKNKKYDEAQKVMKQNFSSANIKKGTNDFQSSITTLKRDSFCFEIKQLPTNSPKADYSPAFSRNGLIFVSNRDVIRPFKLISKRDSSDFYDLYITVKDKNGNFGPPEILKRNSNSLYHEGPSVFMENYHKLIITKSISQNSSKDQKQTLGLFFADWDSTSNSLKVTDIFPFNSSEYSVGQPSISEDGQKLYFVSDMPGGFGGKDLYVSHLEKNQWSTPANLGSTVNTSYDEMFPFIKGNTIYYSSNRPGGLGGLDIYYTSLDKKAKTKNIGYPINSNSDDFGIIFEKDGLSGYLSSSRSSNNIHDDNLYAFSVNEVKLNIKANERLTNAPLANVKVTCKQIAGETDTVFTDSTGKAQIILKPSYIYTLTASKPGYREISSSVSTKTFTTSGFLNAAFNFDRRYKSYVNIFVSEKDNDAEEGTNNCTVLIYNLTRQKLDTTVTNNEGKSLIEVENENLYSFIAYNENMNMRGVEKLSTKKLGKFSKILFLYPKLEKGIVSNITISAVDADSLQPLSNTKITILDKTLNFTSECYADDFGKFSFIGFPDHTYKIVAKKSFLRAELLEYKPKTYKEAIQLQLKSQLE